jgi:hypothetical protein
MINPVLPSPSEQHLLCFTLLQAIAIVEGG